MRCLQRSAECQNFHPASQKLLVLGDDRVTAESFMLRVSTGNRLVLGRSVGGHHKSMQLRKALPRFQLWALLEDGDLSGNVYMGNVADLTTM